MKKIIAKTALFTYFSACMLLMMTRTAQAAYIDPSTTTFIIQAVSGVAIAVGAFVVVLWRKTRKKVAQKLNLDENKNKKMEDEVVEYDD